MVPNSALEPSTLPGYLLLTIALGQLVDKSTGRQVDRSTSRQVDKSVLIIHVCIHVNGCEDALINGHYCPYLYTDTNNTSQPTWSILSR